MEIENSLLKKREKIANLEESQPIKKFKKNGYTWDNLTVDELQCVVSWQTLTIDVDAIEKDSIIKEKDSIIKEKVKEKDSIVNQRDFENKCKKQLEFIQSLTRPEIKGNIRSVREMREEIPSTFSIDDGELKNIFNQLNDNKKRKKKEKIDVHPKCQILIERILNIIKGDVKDIGKNKKLFLYKEQLVGKAREHSDDFNNNSSGKSGNTSRKPDMLIYLANGNTTSHMLRCAQQRTILPIELKTDIALNVIKNYINLPSQSANSSNPVSGIARDVILSKYFTTKYYSLIGDGLNWYFLLWTQKNTFYWEIEYIYIKIDTWNNLGVFVDIFHYFLQKSVYNIRNTSVKIPLNNFTLTKIYNINDNSIVGLMDIKGQKKKVVKLPGKSSRKTILFEKQFLKNTKNLTNTVTCYETQEITELENIFEILVLNEQGISLENKCICEKTLNTTIYNIVSEDINNALKSIHNNKYSYVDLHPGNILIVKQNDTYTAKLIDFESIRYADQDWTNNKGCSDCTNGLYCVYHLPPAQRRGFLNEIYKDNIPTLEKSQQNLENVLNWIKTQTSEDIISVKPTRKSERNKTN